VKSSDDRTAEVFRIGKIFLFCGSICAIFSKLEHDWVRIIIKESLCNVKLAQAVTLASDWQLRAYSHNWGHLSIYSAQSHIIKNVRRTSAQFDALQTRIIYTRWLSQPSYCTSAWQCIYFYSWESLTPELEMPAHTCDYRHTRIISSYKTSLAEELRSYPYTCGCTITDLKALFNHDRILSI